jgi:dephospho-CoA kinase
MTMTGVTGGICEGKDRRREYFAEYVRYALIHAENIGLVQTIRASGSSLFRNLAEASGIP